MEKKKKKSDKLMENNPACSVSNLALEKEIVKRKVDLDFLSSRIKMMYPYYHDYKTVTLRYKGQPYYNASFIVHKCLVPGCRTQILSGGPFCRIHTERIYCVKIGRTMLIDLASDKRYTFMGLFATKKFQAGQSIVPYLCAEDVMDGDFRIDGLDPYLITCNGRQYSSLRYRSIGSFANSRMSSKVYGKRDENPYLKVDPEKCNAEFENRIIMCIKTIEQGEEIYVNYASSSAAQSRREYLNYSVISENKSMKLYPWKRRK